MLGYPIHAASSISHQTIATTPSPRGIPVGFAWQREERRSYVR
jgi:hypothetical protein